jgi:fibronectin-binding autotransporter adhesin
MAGTLVFSGTGDSSLGGLSVQGGAANISAGVLKLSSVGSGLDVTAGTLTVGTNATLDTTAAANNDFISGPAGATLNVIGSGAVYKSGGTLLIGYSAGTTGTLNVSQSGQVSAGTLSISNMGTAVLNISSGGIVNCGEADLGSLLTSGYIATATVSGAGSALNAASLYIGQSSATGNLNINTGGGVYVSTITDIFAMGSINISGGTFSTGELQSNSALIDLIADPIGGTALTINDSTASDHSTYFGTITGAGSLLKTGASTQILSGTNSFTGTVTVNGGTLNMSNAAASSYTVNSGKLIVNTGNVTGPVYVEGGGLLSGQGNYSSVQLLAGSTFLPGAYNGTFGTMTGTTALIQPAASGVTFSHTSITLSAPTAITVNNSTDTLELTSPLTTNNSAITKTGNGSVFLMPFNTSSLTISAGTVSLDTAVGQTPLHLQTLSISGAGTLDLENGSADITTTPLATINPLVKSGYLNGNWNGSGIASLSAQNDSTHLTAIGAIQNNQSGMAIYNSSNKFNGTVPGAGDVLLAYTYYGDANLDGKVDGSDYSRIDAAFLADKTNPTAATGWFNGDFNYDGSVNGSDYTLIDNAFNTQGARLSAQLALPTAQIAGSNQVPEPSISLIALGTIALLARRRGRS